MKINNRLILLSTLILLVLSILSSVYNIRIVYSLTSFSSDFETGNISQWTGTVYGGGANAPIVQQSTVHHGYYALQTTTSGNGWSVAYRDLASRESILYFRSYIRFTALPASGQFVNIYPMVAYDNKTPLEYMHLFNDAGALKWRLVYRTDNVNQNFAYSSTPTIQTNQWYYVEIMYKIGNGDGEAKAWIAPAGASTTEYSPTISVSNLVNDDLNIGHLQLGVYTPSSLSISVFHDCVIATNRYIGIETTSGVPPPSDSSIQIGIASATASSSSRPANEAIDGIENLANGWWSGNPVPQWLMLNLGSLVNINRIVTHFYDGDSRTYTYYIESSSDGYSWNTIISSKTGRGIVIDTFSSVSARFVRITVTGNTVNNYAHIIETRVYGGSLSPSPSPSYSPGIISITFDDGARSQYSVAFPLMRARGIVGTFYIPTAQYPYPAKLYNQLSTSELLEIQAAGNEIGSHSVTHRDFTTLSDQEIIWEASTSKQYLQSNGLIINNFAYPYGTSTTTHINSILANYYRSARMALGTPMTVVQFELNSTYCGWGLNVLKGLVDRAKTQHMWITFLFHDVGSEFSTTDFISLLDYAKASGVRVLTVNQALNQFT